MPEPSSPLLFLGLDGVTHPAYKLDPRDPWFSNLDNPATPKTRPFCCLPALREALAGLEYRVVITSSLRRTYSADELAEKLGGEIGSRVIGMTPDELPEAPAPWTRQGEYEQWIKDRGETAPYLVLDDKAEYFEPGWPQLYLVNGQTGVTATDGIRIRKLMIERGAGRTGASNRMRKPE